MRNLSQLADEICAIRNNAKYAFMTAEAIASLLIAQQLERIADRAQVSVDPITLIDRPTLPTVSTGDPVGMTQAVANQRGAETPAIPSFTGTLRANQPKRK